MRSTRLAILFVVLCGALAALVPASAVASGCGSAGDQQYVDPLQNCNGNGGGGGGSGGGGHSGAGTTTTPPSTSTSPPTTTVSPTATTAATSSTTTSSTSSSSAKDPKTLPYTGLDLAPAVLIALAMVGGGIVLRRAVRDEPR